MFESGYGGGGRALPVYLVLDCSTSMQGAPIEAMRDGMQMLYDEILSDPEARNRVKISVITFAKDAQQTSLTPVKQFIPPLIQAGPSGSDVNARSRRSQWIPHLGWRTVQTTPSICRLDGALNLLVQSIQSDVRLGTGDIHGDYCPLVFLFTSGKPTDEFGRRSRDYQVALSNVRALQYSHKPLIVALACGPEPDTEVLNDITPNVLFMQSVSGPELIAFFRFISGSVKSGSRASATDGSARFPGFTYNPDD